MGGSTNHFNNFHKGMAGWLGPSNTEDVTADGIYTVFPIGAASSGVQSLRIARDTGTFNYLEYRRPTGYFDNFSLTSPVVNGVTIRLAPDYPFYSQSLLLDLNPATTTFGDAPLPVGFRFDDPISGVGVTTLAVDSLQATVQVQFGPGTCLRAAPGIAILPVSQWGMAGQTLNYDVTVWNNDSMGCGTESFDVTGTLPAGWSQTPPSWSVDVPPGQSVTTSIQVGSDPAAPDGTYSFAERVVNAASGSFSASTSAGYNIQPSDATPPVVTILNPADGTVVSKGWVRVSASASDASGISSMEITLDGAQVQLCTNTTTCRARITASSLSAGPHTITVTARDGAPAANAGSASVTILKV
jgi:hypothetical protein